MVDMNFIFRPPKEVTSLSAALQAELQLSDCPEADEAGTAYTNAAGSTMPSKAIRAYSREQPTNSTMPVHPVADGPGI